VTKRVSLLDLQAKKERREPLTMLTAYDYPTARRVDASGVDLVLVGDSLAMVVLGHDSTVPLTMEEMLHHCRAVARGAERCVRVGDLPFLSYQVSRTEAIRNAGRLLQEGGMDAVKLEGGRSMAETARAIVQAGIPVMGHIGFTPQSVSKLGGYRVQGRTAAAARDLMEDARALEAAGCFSIVLEMVPAPVAEALSQRLTVPTIGIGAGAGCDGQVLVYHDLLGLYDDIQPRFVKRFGELGKATDEALARYRSEVEARTFPAPEHTFAIDPEEMAAFLQWLSGADP
jgi:3-methyl-2-oxobutanoate hydroxymethyltransferase